MKTQILNALCLSVILLITSAWWTLPVAVSAPLTSAASVIAQTSTPNLSSPQTPAESPPSPAAEDSVTAEETQSNTQAVPERQPRNSEQAQPTPTESAPPRSPTPSGGPYNMDAIREFNRALYGS